MCPKNLVPVGAAGLFHGKSKAGKEVFPQSAGQNDWDCKQENAEQRNKIKGNGGDTAVKRDQNSNHKKKITEIKYIEKPPFKMPVVKKWLFVCRELIGSGSIINIFLEKCYTSW